MATVAYRYLRCPYCYASSEKPLPGELTTAQSLDLVDQAADMGAEVMVFTGGEPMQRRDLFDIAATYAVTRRLSLTLELPIQYGSRTNAAEHDGVHVHTMRASGIGDLRLSASIWLLNPDKHPDQNILLGLGVKAPTGDDAATDYSFRRSGPELRPVNSAIQPGDGGWGIILAGNAFAKIFKDTFVYVDGFYLINPRETNGVHTINFDNPNFTRGDTSLMFNSVPDQSMVRGGLARPLWRAIGLSGSIGVRWEGIPPRDLIGGDDGYRLPS